MPSQPGGRTFFDRGDPPFTDQERADAGAPPYEPKKGPSGTTSRSYLKDLHDADEEQARQHDPNYSHDKAAGDKAQGDESRSRTGRVDQIKKGANYAHQANQVRGRTVSDTRNLVQGKTPASLAAGVLGLVGYAIAVNFLHGGWPQVKGWFGAKFFNTPYTAATGTTSAIGVAAPVASSTTGSGTVVAPTTQVSVA